jgi:hypothetical protein
VATVGGQTEVMDQLLLAFDRRFSLFSFFSKLEVRIISGNFSYFLVFNFNSDLKFKLPFVRVTRNEIHIQSCSSY